MILSLLFLCFGIGFVIDLDGGVFVFCVLLFFLIGRGVVNFGNVLNVGNSILLEF